MCGIFSHVARCRRAPQVYSPRKNDRPHHSFPNIISYLDYFFKFIYLFILSAKAYNNDWIFVTQIKSPKCKLFGFPNLCTAIGLCATSQPHPLDPPESTQISYPLPWHVTWFLRHVYPYINHIKIQKGNTGSSHLSNQISFSGAITVISSTHALIKDSKSFHKLFHTKYQNK